MDNVIIAYNYGAIKKYTYEMPDNESSNDHEDYEGYIGGSQDGYMDPNYQNMYENDMYEHGYGEPVQDIYAAAYQGADDMGEDVLEDMEDDPYAGIAIDPSKITKPIEPPPEEEQKSEEIKSSSEFSEHKDSQSISDINRGRVEEENKSQMDEESGEGKEKIMNFDEFKKIHDKASEACSTSLKEEQKADESNKEDVDYSDTFINSQLEEEPTKNVVKEPENNLVELSGGDIYSYDNDFETSSVPANSNEHRVKYKVITPPTPQVKKEEEKTQIVEVVKRITVEHKNIQTDLGPIKFADKSTRECMLEAMILDEKRKVTSISEDMKEKEGIIKRLQENLKKQERACIGAKKTIGISENTIKKVKLEKDDLLNQIESLKDEKQELNHKISDLSTELAEAQSLNVRIQNECERRIRLAEDHAEAQSKKLESRIIQELQQRFDLDKSLLKKEIEDKDAELDYYKEKLTKVEAENNKLTLLERNQGSVEGKLREIENENIELKAKLDVLTKFSMNEGGDRSLEQEVRTQEALIKGYQKENENMTNEVQSLKGKIKEMEAMMYKENVRLRKEQNNLIKSTDKIAIVENTGNIQLATMNDIGKSNLITRGELRNLKLNIEVLEADKKRLEEQLAITEKQTQGQIGMLIRQREELEERAGMKYEDHLKEKQDKQLLISNLQNERIKHIEEAKGLQSKIKLLLENQQLMEKNIEFLKQKDEEIKQLRKKVKELVEINKTTREEASEVNKLKKEIEELKKQQKQEEKEHAAKIKSLRLLYERAKSKQEVAVDKNKLKVKKAEQKETLKHKKSEQKKEEIKSIMSETMPEHGEISKLELYVTQELQKWLPISGIDSLRDKYDSELISPENFIKELNALNCPLDIENVYVWMRKLNLESDGSINYITVLDDINTKSIEWWADFLNNYKQKKEVPESLLPFMESSIIAKVHTKPILIEEANKILKEYPAEELNDIELNKVIKEINSPLNAEDINFIITHIGHNGLISKEILTQFLFQTQYTKEQNAIKEAWGEEPVPEKAPSEITGSQKQDKWEMKARSIYAKYKETNNNLENMKRQNKIFQSKLKTIYKDPKYAHILALNKKIETLEEVIRERDQYIRKTLGGANEVEMATLKRNTESEKEELVKIIEEKNKEILMFKRELDAVLLAMERMKAKTIKN